MSTKKQIVIFFVIMGLITTLAGLKFLSDAKSNSSWPVTEGVIIKSERNSERSSDGDYHDYPDIKYLFEVEGEEYTGFQISTGNFNRPIEEYLQKYPVGKKVTVYYKPGNPSNCYLEPGVSWQSYMGLILGILLLVAGVSISIFYKQNQSNMN